MKAEQIEIQAYPFNSINKDRVYKAEDIQEQRKMFFSNGVFIKPSNNLQVEKSSGLEIKVNKGGANIEGVGAKISREMIIPLELPDGVNDRIDRVTLRLDRVKRGVYIYVKIGEYSSDPKPRDLQRTTDAYEIALADIYVKHGVTEISQSDITDLRLDEELCGITQFNGTDIDYEHFYKQYEQRLKELVEEIESVIGENAVSNILYELAKKQDKLLSDHGEDENFKNAKYNFEVRNGILGLKVVDV